MRPMLSFQLWHALQNPNEGVPLYLNLKLTYHRSRWWATRDFTALTLVIVVFNVLLAPLFALLPVLTIFVISTYWAGYVAGQIQAEHTYDRFDVLALVPDGAMAVCWMLSTLHIRTSNVYHYVFDGLRITVLIGGMILFVLVSGVLIAVLDTSGASAESVPPLLTAAVTLAVFLIVLYVQQVQAVILSQLLGIAVPTLVDEVIKTRAWAIVLHMFVQLGGYTLALTVGAALAPPIFVVRVLLGGAVLVCLHESLIVLLWRRLAAQFGAVSLDKFAYRTSGAGK